jgi:hypothetical protein
MAPGQSTCQRNDRKEMGPSLQELNQLKSLSKSWACLGCWEEGRGHRGVNVACVFSKIRYFHLVAAPFFSSAVVALLLLCRCPAMVEFRAA